MKILFDITHPAHVHFFKYTIWELEKRNHDILITTRDKDVTLQLLDAYDLEYMCLGKSGKGIAGLFLELITRDYKLYKVAKHFKPDLLISISGLFAAQVGKFLGKQSIVFTDTEHAKLANAITFPFANAVCTPTCFKGNLGKKHIKYNGYHECAYLHPNYFKPDESVLEELGLNKDDKFVIIRFVSWGASHDVGQSGFTSKAKRKLVKELEKHARVFITSEKPLEAEFERYRITISLEKIHHLLYFAQLYVGEGATMATEAGILGTPSVYLSSLVGTMGGLEELMNKYQLVYSFKNSERASEMALNLLRDGNSKEKWQTRREIFLRDKIDVTQWTVEFVENFN